MAVTSGKFVPPKWCRAPASSATWGRLRFVSDATANAAAVRPGEEIDLGEKALYTIGRAESDVDVRLRGDLASRMHAAVCQDVEGRKFIVDLRSTHGTFLGGKRLDPHVPVRWTPDLRVTFGAGPSAEVLQLLRSDEAGSDGKSHDGKASVELEQSSPSSKRQRVGVAAERSEELDPMAALYGDLPEATVNQVAPRAETRKWVEPLPVPVEVTRVIFLDIDGVLRSVHGRTDFGQNVRTMVVGGHRVALVGDSTSTNDNLAGIDFWPQALRALKHIVQKTQAGIVLSSDWRKQDQLIDGVNNQLREHGMPKLHACTPDLDSKQGGVVLKALHSNVREKRTKEIRKWLRQNPKIQCWVAIDDMDLTASRKDELLHSQSGSTEPMPFLDSTADFVRCNPAVGLTMELAKLAVAFMNGVEVTQEDVATAYGQGPQQQDHMQTDPSLQALGPTTFIG